jgi:septum formation protein
MKKIILGSASPRRKYLLEQAGFNVSVHPLDVDERFSKDIPLSQVALFLAQKKSNAYLEPIPVDSILLTADSTVLLENQILGKPENFDEAISYIMQLSGKVHQVITGVVLRDSIQYVEFQCLTLVEFAPVELDEANFYVRQYQPFDKAGGYGLQEWIGLCKVKSIQGTYSNVMGLPIHEVYEKIKHW